MKLDDNITCFFSFSDTKIVQKFRSMTICHAFFLSFNYSDTLLNGT